MNNMSYDYIIVGAGSAGCTLAHRLGEDPHVRILVLEAGGPDTSFFLKMPSGFAALGEGSPYNWHYRTEPQAHCNNRQMYWPRGRTLGGSSSINAMLYIRGNAWDYDYWRQLGNDGWSFQDVLPYFKKSQHQERGGSLLHGIGGPLNVTDQVTVATVSQVFVEACRQAGYPINADFNGPEQEGIGTYQVTQKNAQRWSTASAYLRPALARGNVTVLTGAQVARVKIEKGQAVGVDYRYDGKDQTTRANREVILAGGAINSPQLLMLSGVGPAEHLKSKDIKVEADVPGVGANLQDHLDASTLYHCTTRETFDTANKLATLARYIFTKTGPGTSPIAEAGGFLKTQNGLSAPDIQLHFIPAFVIDHGRTKLGLNGFTLHVCQLRPESRGTIRLKSNDPFAHPAIDPNYLNAGKDLVTLIAGTKIARDIFAQRAFENRRGEEREPGTNRRTDAELESWIRDRSESIYHPVGTCKMGTATDLAAVVDSQLRVRGVAGLRVVDASIMPTVIGGNTNAPVIMIAERAADLIKGTSLASASFV
ncbi:MAG: choline dehydrogenase [Hyphomicrobiaceae bacterium]